MKVQSVGNYDCQRKNDVNFKAMPVVEKAQSKSNAYVERVFSENPVRFVADFFWTVLNGVIKRITRAMS